MSKNQLIDIQRVAEILGRSVRVIRDYKRLGMLAPVRKQGMKDLYNEPEIQHVKGRLDDLLLSKSLAEASQIIVRERNRSRKETTS